jgi:hypothetical protein
MKKEVAETICGMVDDVLGKLQDFNNYINKRDGTPFEAKFAPQSWWFHPDNESDATDVAACSIDFSADEEFSMVPIIGPEAVVATLEVMKDLKIGVGDEVVIAGLFRSHHGRQRNIPIVRIGNIAMIQDEPVWTKYCGYTDAHLVEARSIGGLSGSPVFVHMPPVRVIDGKSQISSTAQCYLLGLMHGHFDIENLNEDVVTEDERGATSGIHTGIGVVIPVEKIIETLLHPELEEMRKTALTDFKRTQGATADSLMAPPRNGANPAQR